MENGNWKSEIGNAKWHEFEKRSWSKLPEIKGNVVRLSMLAPTRGKVGNFPCLEWQTCPRGRDIESLKCACAIRIVRVRGLQYSAMPA